MTFTKIKISDDGVYQCECHSGKLVQRNTITINVNCKWGLNESFRIAELFSINNFFARTTPVYSEKKPNENINFVNDFMMSHCTKNEVFKGTLMQIWKSPDMFVFI